MADLGQIFTKRDVANFMVSLFDIGNRMALLDPCYGKGAFLKALKSKGFLNVTAYEIDNDLFEEGRVQFPKYKLLNKDFLGAKKEFLYDGIIMNPPYVRQEKIDELSYLGITKEKLKKESIYAGLPKTANLYMYFIIKAIELLKPSGELVVIFPSSWMQARSGEGFKKLMLTKCSIVKEIHITGDVFEQNALVDVVILKVVKKINEIKKETEYLTIRGGEFQLIKNHKDKNLAFEQSFASVASIKRGMTTGCNSMFINPKFIQKDSFVFLKPIISSPKNINGYSTQNAKTDLVFLPNDNVVQSSEIKRYIKKWKQKILKDKKPKTLYEKIVSKVKWYDIREMNGKGIIFSYFVRDDMKFIMNNKDMLIRDNFYIIKPKIDIDILFALLNNYYTYYQLEMLGKKYGAGLLKLQRYDVEAIRFPSYQEISQKHRNELKKIAIALTKTSDVKYVERITKIVGYYSSVTCDEIKKMYCDIKEKRLEATNYAN